MKTINDLVYKLNKYGAYGEYYIKKGKNDSCLLCKRYTEGEDATLFEFAKKQPYWSIHPSLGVMHNQVQKEIMDFIYTTDRTHWFDEQEKKYNIVIGEDVSGNYKTAYYKIGHGADVTDTTTEYELALDKYKFTESEIEELKSDLPENMKKIVDLGKVEVTNED